MISILMCVLAQSEYRPRLTGWRDALNMLPLFKTVMAMKPKTSKKAACQEVVLSGDDIDLAKLPVQTCWPGEPAPLITWPLVVTKGPEAMAGSIFNR